MIGAGKEKSRARRCQFDRASLAVVAGLVLLLSLPTRAAEPATITFSLDFPNSDPEHYSIVVQSDGHARYECSAKISSDSDDRETYQTDFVFSEATRARIFELATQAHYFSGKVDSGNHKLAFTGAKKLVYKDGQRETAAAYNFSSLPAGPAADDLISERERHPGVRPAPRPLPSLPEACPRRRVEAHGRSGPARGTHGTADRKAGAAGDLRR